MDNLREIINSVDGWLSEEEGQLLCSLAKNCKGRGVIVEIGSWHGKSTICLGLGSQSGFSLPVYAIDPHQEFPDNRPIFINNIKQAGLENIITPVFETSAEAAQNFNQPIELIFIDGDHAYEAVKKDCLNWLPRVVGGGVVVFHDVTSWGHEPGSKRAFWEEICCSSHFRNINICGSSAWAVKVADNLVRDQARNRLMGFRLSWLALPWRLRKFIYFSGQRVRKRLGLPLKSPPLWFFGKR